MKTQKLDGGSEMASWRLGWEKAIQIFIPAEVHVQLHVREGSSGSGPILHVAALLCNLDHVVLSKSFLPDGS